MSGSAVGFVLILIGAVLVSQMVVGDAVARIRTWADPNAGPGGYEGPKGLAYSPKSSGGKLRVRRGTLSIGPGVKHGDPAVYDVLADICERVGGRWILISWYRPGSIVAGSKRPSCHGNGKGTGKGAGDVVPADRDWKRADQLAAEAARTPGVGEVVFRGDAMHDPNLGADAPHVHIGVGCG